jgi:hypothetical protein
MHRGFDGGGPAALGVGVLTEDGGCLFLQMDQPGDRQLIVWPQGFRLVQDGDGGIAVDASGVAVPVGARVQLGGGAYEDRTFVEERLTSGPLRAACVTRSIWMATRLVP